jgi:2-polyprenyl-3-methyl-5-hydroxy-6-metoxy-1,4-benzoquinol methylase
MRLSREGPTVQDLAMLDALEPLAGRRVLDFACGAGLLTAWLAERGAEVAAIDLSPISIKRAGEFLAEVGVRAELVCGEIESLAADDRSFERVTGRFAPPRRYRRCGARARPSGDG